MENKIGLLYNSHESNIMGNTQGAKGPGDYNLHITLKL